MRKAQTAYQDKNLWTQDTLSLEPGEYEGPLVVDRTCRIDGHGATLVAASGPVLLLRAPNVHVRDLRVELTGQRGVAIEATAPGARFESVSVRGSVMGVRGEDAEWKVPSVIRLGDFAAGESNSFSVRLSVPMAARITTRMRGVKVSPTILHAGENTLRIVVEPMAANTILYGELWLETAVTRRIWLSGKAVQDAPRKQAKTVPPTPAQPQPCASGDVLPPSGVPRPPASHSGRRPAPASPSGPKERQPQPRAAGRGNAAPSAPAERSRQGARALQRGERVTVPDPPPRAIRVLYHGAPGAQPYVFLLNGARRAASGEDVICPANHTTRNGSVSAGIAKGMPLVMIHLRRLPPEVERVSVCFCMPEHTRRSVLPQGTRIETEADGAPWLDLSPEPASDSALVAVDLYRYKGAWKLQAVGACPKGGLKALYEGAGLSYNA